MIEVSVAFMLITFVVFVGYGRFAIAIRDNVTSNPCVSAWVRHLLAAGFATSAVLLMIGDG
jgi:threonine/homoserine/homoserine lactone efflux protein